MAKLKNIITLSSKINPGKEFFYKDYSICSDNIIYQREFNYDEYGRIISIHDKSFNRNWQLVFALKYNKNNRIESKLSYNQDNNTYKIRSYEYNEDGIISEILYGSNISKEYRENDYSIKSTSYYADILERDYLYNPTHVVISDSDLKEDILYSFDSNGNMISMYDKCANEKVVYKHGEFGITYVAEKFSDYKLLTILTYNRLGELIKIEKYYNDRLVEIYDFILSMDQPNLVLGCVTKYFDINRTFYEKYIYDNIDVFGDLKCDCINANIDITYLTRRPY